jgi:dTDP-L-rhamnose 4-epimerase
MDSLISGSPKKILITGGLGFIGSHLADVFQKRGEYVRILDIATRPDAIAPEIDYVRGSAAEKNAVSQALAGIDYVIHLAVYPGYFDDYSTYFAVNAASAALLYEACRGGHFPVKQIIIASSQSVYGEGKYRCSSHGIFYPGLRSPEQLKKGEWNIRCPHDNEPAEVLPSEENDTLLPVSPYGISKLAADHIGRVMGTALGIPTTVLRFSMVYGAHEAMRGLYAGAIKFYTERILAGQDIPMHEDGNQMRDFVNVKDVGMAVDAVLGNKDAFFGVFNIGAGRAISLRELAGAICRHAGTPLRPVFRNEFRPFTPRHWILSPDKAKKVLAWEAAYSLEESVREYVAAAKKFL